MQTSAEILRHARLPRQATRHNDALTAYRAYLALHSEDDEARAAEARLLSWQGHYDESVAIYRDILLRHPQDLDIRVALARVNPDRKSVLKSGHGMKRCCWMIQKIVKPCEG